MHRLRRNRPARAAVVTLLGVLALTLAWELFAEGPRCSTSPDDLFGCFVEQVAVVGLGVPLLVYCQGFALRGLGGAHSVGGAVTSLSGGALLGWSFSTVSPSPVVASYAPLVVALTAAALIALWADLVGGTPQPPREHP
ncbi:hypothetical protein [Nocardioides aurantiacus]|uniref:Uncharacterized protein n=1 Tax=Nocardioides aurantiacus TaxID=86796 RepID=A0A3N2CP92_9ACTN|nr:hypothetical protein [Nocardioides aurantiacus]ROR89349.1 hypothetical protein EDD33_0169 [Nocardioides aurantiacus]